MNILSKLENLDEKEDLIIRLQREELPLVMWGAGELANEINIYLKKNNIILADIFVDDEYYSKNMIFDDKKVLSYTMLREKYEIANLILGNSNYEEIKKFEKIGLFNQIFYLFSVNYGIYNKTPMNEIRENSFEFEEVYNLFADQKSKDCFIAFLSTRLSGNNKYIMDVYEKEMNFFNNEIFCIDQNEVLLDIGAYDGDTIRLFLRESYGRYGYIYALEPDKGNREKLEKYVKKNKLENIFITEKGAWKEKGILHFTEINDQISSVITNTNGRKTSECVDIQVEKLDDMFHYLQNISFLKINYLEGVVEALEGAEYILKVHQPKLAVTVGFDCRNIRYVPKLIKKINPAYKLYLRFNRGMISSLTCYGIVS